MRKRLQERGEGSHPRTYPERSDLFECAPWRFLGLWSDDLELFRMPDCWTLDVFWQRLEPSSNDFLIHGTEGNDKIMRCQMSESLCGCVFFRRSVIELDFAGIHQVETKRRWSYQNVRYGQSKLGFH